MQLATGQEYTSGPLTVAQNTNTRYREAGDCAIVDDAGKIIGEAFVLVAEGTTRPALANATLWAAAPDLLATIERLRALLKDDATCRIWTSGLGNEIMLGNAMQAVDDAIAKARGTQP